LSGKRKATRRQLKEIADLAFKIHNAVMVEEDDEKAKDLVLSQIQALSNAGYPVVQILEFARERQ